MKTLFTPWRFTHISSATEQESCFFCEAAAEPTGPDSLVVTTTSSFLVMLNRYPYTNGHLMVAPLEHLADPQQAKPEATAEFWPLVLACQRVLTRAYSPNGFNMGLNLGRAAGAGVPGHFHFHIVPRWEGDTNFMTAVGETRLVPQIHSEVLETLRPLFSAEEN